MNIYFNKNNSLGVFLTFLISISLASPAWAACQKTELLKADAAWAKAIESNNVQKIVNQYAPKAVLMATVENKPIISRAGKVNYFTKFFETYPKVQVHYIGEQYLQIFSGGAVSSGLYVFSSSKAGKPIEVHARYTFVYRDTPKGCQLITHHSSKLPN